MAWFHNLPDISSATCCAAFCGGPPSGHWTLCLIQIMHGVNWWMHILQRWPHDGHLHKTYDGEATFKLVDERSVPASACCHHFPTELEIDERNELSITGLVRKSLRNKYMGKRYLLQTPGSCHFCPGSPLLEESSQEVNTLNQVLVQATAHVHPRHTQPLAAPREHVEKNTVLGPPVQPKRRANTVHAGHRRSVLPRCSRLQTANTILV